jgi:nitric-oxide synthase
VPDPDGPGLGPAGAQGDPTGDVLSQARAFFRSMVEHGVRGADDHWYAERVSAVEVELARSGTYVHTRVELEFGARLAWYHSNRCIGRHFWRSLKVFDARNVATADGVRRALERQMASAFNQGRIQSTITVFPPRGPGPDRVRMGNHQLVRYAGFRDEVGGVVGDPDSTGFTDHCLKRGWDPPRRNRFTPLPWCIWIDGEELPPDDVFLRRPDLLHEVGLSHPESESFCELGLRWYAVPFLADMALVIGGIVYPFAPFNGFYMGTEIGARNLADRDRYDVLPAVAATFGWDTSDHRTLWRDRALVELNRAVLHSFDRSGIRIGDHHALGASFSAFCSSEARRGRTITGEWSWLVPPMSGALSPLFQQEFEPTVSRHSNYLLQPPMGTRPPVPGTSTRCPYHL